MDRKYIAIIVPGVILISATVWLTLPTTRPTKIDDFSKIRYMHCPDCNREWPFSPDKYEHPCPYCDRRLIATEQSVKVNGTGPSPYSTLVLLVFVELLAIMAVLWFVSRPRTHDPEDDFLYINCEKCKQKIRFRRDQVGQRAMCRRCKHTFIYPEEETGGE
jgi:ribosomal protein S27E